MNIANIDSPPCINDVNGANTFTAPPETLPAGILPTARYLVWAHLQGLQGAMTVRQLAAVFPSVADLNSILFILTKGKHVTKARVRGTNYYAYTATSLEPLKLRKNNVQGVETQQVTRIKVPLHHLVSTASLAQARQFTSAPLVRYA